MDTPRGTPSPPNAASTVARPNKPPAIRIHDLESSLEYLSKWKGLAEEGDASGRKAADGDDTSLGLLPADTVANCTLSATTNSQSIGIADPSRSAIFGISRLQLLTPESIEHPHISEELLTPELTNVSQNSKEESNTHPQQNDERQMPSRPSSRLSNQQNEYNDDSAETVIRKQTPRESPCLMMFSPAGGERITTPVSPPILANKDIHALSY